MAQSRNPSSGQFAEVAPTGTAESTPPGLPEPGLNSAERRDPLPLLAFSPPPSLCQSGSDLTALSTPPGGAGPTRVIPATPMQDFGQPPEQTITAGDTDDQ